MQQHGITQLQDLPWKIAMDGHSIAPQSQNLQLVVIAELQLTQTRTRGLGSGRHNGFDDTDLIGFQLLPSRFGEELQISELKQVDHLVRLTGDEQFVTGLNDLLDGHRLG